MRSEQLTDSGQDAFFCLHYAVKGTLFDILLVKETTGGIYTGERGRIDGNCAAACAVKAVSAAEAACGKCCGSGSEEAYDTEKYSWYQIERVMRIAYTYANKRKKKLCVVDKADILESSRLWRETAEEVSKEFPQITTDFLLIENAVKQLIIDPAQFDVIVTSNMFGDILAGELSALTGNDL